MTARHALLEELRGVRAVGEIGRLANRAIAGDEFDVPVLGLAELVFWPRETCDARRCVFIDDFSAGGGHRTHTPLAGPRILSPVRLPIPPPRHVV